MKNCLWGPSGQTASRVAFGKPFVTQFPFQAGSSLISLQGFKIRSIGFAIFTYFLINRLNNFTGNKEIEFIQVFLFSFTKCGQRKVIRQCVKFSDSSATKTLLFSTFFFLKFVGEQIFLFNPSSFSTTSPHKTLLFALGNIFSLA